MFHNLDSKHYSARKGRSVTKFKRLKDCCHHSLRDGNKKDCTHEDIDNYLDGCIICLKSFSDGCVLPMMTSNHITKIKKIEENKKGKEKEKEKEKEMNAWFVQYDYFHLFDLC